MRELTLGYVLEGTRRGYNFTSPTDGIDGELLKALWRSAMPRGQGWSDPAYRGSSSLKCFPLPTGEIAACEVTMTDLRDEVGREGIRTATIRVFGRAEYERYLHQRLAALPVNVVAEAERRLTSREWALMFRKVRDMNRPRTMIKPQTVLAAPYDPAGWPFVEACALLLATRSTLLANLIEVSPTINPFADRVLSFTTLALDWRDETRLIGMPLAKARSFEELPFVDIGK